MSEELALGNLWGATVTHHHLDFARFTLRLDLEVQWSGERRFRSSLVCFGIIAMHYADNAPLHLPEHFAEPWDYIELTSIEARRITRDGQPCWQVRAELWTALLEVICQEVRLTPMPPTSPPGIPPP